MMTSRKTATYLTIAVAITISIVFPSSVAGRATRQEPLTFCNPINLEYRFAGEEPSRRVAADPVIVLFRDTYYLFSTGSNEYWYSSDLVNWTLVSEEKSQLPKGPTAPAVTVIDDAVYFVPSSRRTGLFYRSTDPKSGKWELAAKSIPGWDPALFHDDDGRVYLYCGCSNRDPFRELSWTGPPSRINTGTTGGSLRWSYLCSTCSRGEWVYSRQDSMKMES